MIKPSPVRHHMTRRHDPVRLCDEQPADDDLSGEIPPELGSLSNLTYLDLGFNLRLSGEIPAWLGSLSNLTYLGLSYTALSGEIPAERAASPT